MKKIVVVEATSTGANYIADIIKRGYEPIILEPIISQDSVFFEAQHHSRKEARKKYPCNPVTIEISDNYEETLEKVRKLNPILVIPGTESGVELATRLSEDLGLPGNPYKNMDTYLKKSAMHTALINAGVRGIRGRLVKSYKEACAFMEEIGTENIVVKPTRSAASQGIKLCQSADEVKEGVEELIGNHNYYGDTLDEVLLQERIFGTEYIVNTMSRAGKHKVLSIWKYDKVKTNKGGNVYNYMESIEELGIGHSELIEYAFSVLDAIGITDGPVHGEYMIDKKGPVLIEINCRVMGAGIPAGFLDRVNGHHETDVILDAFLNEEQFLKHLNDPYRSLRKGIMKSLITPKDIDVEASPIRVILDNLQSLYGYFINDSAQNFHLKKTEDLDSNSGMIFLVHDNPEVTKRECSLLHLLETNYFRMLFHGSGKKETPPNANAFSITDAVKMMDCCGCSLIVSDMTELPEGIQSVAPNELNIALNDYDRVYFALSSYGEGIEVEATIKAIFDAMKKVKYGGYFIVPESFYQLIPYGRALIETLLIIGGFTIEAPLYNTRHLVTGRRV
jgi:biotin carboxylase